MENCDNGREKRKRGPYKQYQFKDSVVSIPKSTQYALQHPEQKRARRTVPRKKVLQESQTRNTECQASLTSKCSDVDPAAVIVSDTIVDPVLHIAAASSELLNNDNGCPAPVDNFAEMIEDEDENDDTSEQQQCFEYYDEEELFEQVLNDEPTDTDNIENDDDDSPDESDEECAAAPNLHLSVKNRIKLLLLLATKKRHNLTYSAAESIMKLNGLFSNDEFLTSKYFMKEAITEYSSSDLTVHYMCPNCGFYIGQIENRVNCNNCQHVVDINDSKAVKSFFLYLSVKKQITTLLESGLSSNVIDLQSRSKMCGTNYEDVFDGKLYRRLVPEGAFSFHFFVDGLQVSSTSKYSAWPVLLTLNELPLHLRRKFVLMASVWLDKKKPDINQYMKPFVEESVDMYHNGVTYKENGITKVKQIVPLMGISDSVARPLLRNSKQFNGMFGCGLCYHPGYRLRFGRGYIRSYSLRNGDFPMRTHDETMQLAREADGTGRFRRGIGGKSILSDIPNFDIVHCLDVDSFHCLVNVAKRFTNLWVGKKRVNEPYNVRNRLALIDRRFLAITTTDDISRAPRSLTERSDFRGHEWFNWIVFFSLPCLKNILPPRFLNHWALLVHGVALLMQNSVAKSEVYYAGRYFKQFNEEIDLLYGAVHVTFSVHLLTHLENSVVNFAQPWTHSAFLFESFNGELKDSVKSSNGVAHQITKHMQLRIALQNMRADLESHMSDPEKEYLSTMMSSSKGFAEPHLVLGPVALLGEPKRITLSEEHRHALVRSDVAFDRSEEYSLYERAIVNCELFQSCNYKRVRRQDNSVVLLESNKILQIQSFLVISNTCYALGYYFKERRHAKVCDRNLPHYLLLGERECMLRCIAISDFKMKLLFFTIKLSDEETLRLGCVNVLKMEMLH